MNDIHVTLSGNVTDDPRQYRFRDGSRVTSLRIAVNRRVLDQQTNTWQTRDTTYYTVRCYRGLADNVQQSIRKGHPVVVYGKLRIKQFERDGEQRFWAEIEASSVGHDLKWGIATFEKPVRAYSAGAPSDGDRQAMEDATREWELIGSAAHAEARSGGDDAFDALVGDRAAREAEHPASAGHADAVGRSDRRLETGPARQSEETMRGDESGQPGEAEGADQDDTDEGPGRGAEDSWRPPALAA